MLNCLEKMKTMRINAVYSSNICMGLVKLPKGGMGNTLGTS